MNNPYAIFLTLNNILHDLATALLFVCSTTMWRMLRSAEGLPHPDLRLRIGRSFALLSRTVLFALVWLSAGAVPRILTLRSVELPQAEASRTVPLLIARELIGFAVLTAGVLLWISVKRRIVGMPPPPPGPGAAG